MGADRAMATHHVHAVAVLGIEPGERPVGILSSLDVAGVIAWGRG